MESKVGMGDMKVGTKMELDHLHLPKRVFPTNDLPRHAQPRCVCLGPLSKLTSGHGIDQLLQIAVSSLSYS